jgi:hypothetical protein
LCPHRIGGTATAVGHHGLAEHHSGREVTSAPVVAGDVMIVGS